MKCFVSNVEWPEVAYRDADGSNVSKDFHHTREQAEFVCKMIEKDGMGGAGQIFPVKTWVSELHD